MTAEDNQRTIDRLLGQVSNLMDMNEVLRQEVEQLHRLRDELAAALNKAKS